MFRGTGTALITPFINGEFDQDSYARLIENQINSGVNALIVLGTTGEAATLNSVERDQVISFAVAQVKGRVPVIVGTGTNNTATTIENSQKAFELGADGALVVTPYYNKPTQAGLIAHFKAVAQSVAPKPIILYNVPGRTGCRLDFSSIMELQNTANILGLKDATGDQYEADLLCRHLKTVRPDFKLWSGNDDSAFHLVLSGGDGVISVVSNLVPQLMSQMINAALENHVEQARKLHLQLLPLAHDLFIETNPCPVKYGAKLLGFGDGSLRLPLVPVTQRTATLVEADLAELDLI